MLIRVDQAAGTPPYEQVRTQIATLVRSGALPVGTRLPTVRKLAEDLGLAVNTVARSYKELEADGVIETRGRHGTFVAAVTNASRTPPRPQPFMSTASGASGSATRKLCGISPPRWMPGPEQSRRLRSNDAGEDLCDDLAIVRLADDDAWYMRSLDATSGAVFLWRAAYDDFGRALQSAGLVAEANSTAADYMAADNPSARCRYWLRGWARVARKHVSQGRRGVGTGGNGMPAC